MLLIIFLGLIATLTSVSSDCDVGTQEMNDYNFIKANGTWYVFYHSSNDIENKLECVVLNFGPPERNISVITLQAYNASAQSYSTIIGIATNWNSSALEEIYPSPSMWSGRYYVIAVDYDSYCIHKFCSFESNQLYVYVSFRSPHPTESTLRRALEKLKENNIDVSQMVKYRADKCQQAESSEEEENEEEEEEEEEEESSA